AVVRFVARVTNALDLRSTDRTGLAESPVYREIVPECGDFFRESGLGFLAEPGHPIEQRRFGRLIQSTDLFLAELSCLRNGREPRTMQNFIRIRIAYTAEQIGISERSFQSVVLGSQRRCELLQSDVKRLNAPSL